MRKLDFMKGGRAAAAPMDTRFSYAAGARGDLTRADRQRSTRRFTVMQALRAPRAIRESQGDTSSRMLRVRPPWDSAKTTRRADMAS
jgi:hypothetical protein